MFYSVRTNNSIRQNTTVFIKVPIWQWSRATSFDSSESSSGPQDTDLISYVVVSLLHCGIPNAYKFYIRWVLIFCPPPHPPPPPSPPPPPQTNHSEVKNT